nr:hypothetical protein [uncultured Oscillibacter sp.]
MKRRKRLPTRRRDALRHASRALILLLLVQNLLHVGLLLPVQALRETEEREGVCGTKVLRRIWEPDIYKTSLFYLTASENALLLGDVHFTHLGWFPQFGAALDCTGGAPLYAAERTVSRYGQEGTYCFFYGRADAPSIETVELSLRYISGYDEAEGENIYQEHVRLTVPKESWMERDGHRYFLLPYKLEGWPYQTSEHTFVTGRDNAGKVVTEFEITEGSYASYG